MVLWSPNFQPVQHYQQNGIIMGLSVVEAELQHYKTETRPFMRLLEGVVGFTVVFSKEEKDPAQGAEFDSDTIKMVNI